MRSYEAARNLFGFLGFCAWCVVLLGVIVAFIGGTAASTGFRSGPNELQILLGAAPGGIVALAGFYGLALVQMGRTSVDSAEYGQQALEVSRQQLEVSREALAQGKTAAASYAELLKRQPAQKVKPSDGSVHADASPSYSNRPTQSEPPLGVDDTKAGAVLADQVPDATAQLEHTPTLAADDVLQKDRVPVPALEVTKVGGTYQVGNKAFKTAREAHQYAAASTS